MSHTELVQLNELLDKLIIDTDGSVLNGLSSILSLESQEVDDFINATKKYYGELRFSALRNLSYQGVIHEDAEAMISCLATIPYIAFSQEIYHFVNQALKERCEAINVDAVMIERPVLLFSDETESSNSRAPALAIEEDFGDLRLEASNESSSLKNMQRKNF
ncbi:hypothetical protein CC99x_005995 [Candidatus Berkiella cookevillensis]|uniref:Uncharacterized protein n=1 Tax=Candidatus Berkiella cookevillensis TaxID=437022 RepID=A0A0Q9YT02_9GAMM|nr:hypothetical protein [Candidatus Berkiella cookevillensis]MCS5708456.1 hypothetical protein [Candidatus Berkiella cookevillensis]